MAHNENRKDNSASQKKTWKNFEYTFNNGNNCTRPHPIGDESRKQLKNPKLHRSLRAAQFQLQFTPKKQFVS